MNEFKIEKYLYRVVTSCNQLTEKIYIFDTDENNSNFFVLFNEGEYVTATEIDSIYENLSKASENWSDIRDDDIVINQEWILNRIEEE